MDIKLKRMTEDAILPSRSNEGDAGLDLYATESVVLGVGQFAKIGTGWAFQIPYRSVGLIWPRSKLSAKKGISILAGVVDSGYRGEVMISLINLGRDPVEIRKGDKIAQIIIQPVDLLNPVEVEELDDTDRGSSGINDTDLRLRD